MLPDQVGLVLETGAVKARETRTTSLPSTNMARMLPPRRTQFLDLARGLTTLLVQVMSIANLHPRILARLMTLFRLVRALVLVVFLDLVRHLDRL